MRLLIRDHLRRNIEGCGIHRSIRKTLKRKSQGKIEWILGLFLIQFVIVFMMFEFQILSYKAASDRMEDALAASGLASALIDIQRYGVDRVAVISDSEAAYSIYKNTLAENLGVDESEIGSNPEARIVIEKYIIYNVENDCVRMTGVDDSGEKYVNTGQLGAVKDPDGRDILTTSVYSEIAFEVEGVWGVTVRAKKGKLVEINKSLKETE